jgi:LL-diaminopimelate aminotransferase
VNPVLSTGPVYPFAALEARKQALRAEGKRLHDFTIGDPLEPTPEFIRRALADNIPAVSQYPTVAGRPSFRRAVSAYFSRRFTLSVDPDTEVIPTSGAKEALFHLPMALVDPSSEKRTVIYGEPAYPVYERAAAYAGAKVHAVALTADRGFLLEPSQLPAKLLDETALVFVNYPHNPTGAFADRAYFQRLSDAARRHAFVVVSDETYADLHDGTPPPSLLEVMREGALVVHSLSKRSGMTGFRSGFIAGDPKLIAALKKMRPTVGVASPEFIQAAAEAAWSDDAHVEERRRIFGEKRRRVLESALALGCRPVPGTAGLYVWMKPPEGIDAERYAARLLEGGVVVTPGAAFGPSGRDYFRMALVPLLVDLPEALEAWRRAHFA